MKRKIYILAIFILFAFLFEREIFNFHKVFAADSATVQATIKITVCGNNTKETGEQCDGSDLGGASCSSQGFSGGTLSCGASCDFNTSACTSGGGSSGGGGGGGGGSDATTPPVATNTKVILQGKASPAAYLTVLKDGQVIANTQANSQADFKIEVANLVAGIYTFGIWGEDNSGTRSITFSFTVNVASGTTTTVSNIFLPSTIALSKDSVKRGETIGILGQTVPQAQVEIHVSSTNIIEKVIASNLGSWFYNLDTSRLEEGVHSARAKVSTADGLLSTFSQTMLFGVGVPISTEAATQTSDLNNDQKINLIDFSIILYNWGTPKNSAADLNNDKKVDLIDFSIMLYYWTG